MQAHYQLSRGLAERMNKDTATGLSERWHKQALCVLFVFRTPIKLNKDLSGVSGVTIGCPLKHCVASTNVS